MILGSMRELRLSKAKDIFLLDCRAAGLHLQTRRLYCDVLTSFIHFTGNMLVRELGPDHVRLYIANLSDYPSKHERLLTKHYAIIRTWIRWIYAQRWVLERHENSMKSPRWKSLTARRFIANGLSVEFAVRFLASESQILLLLNV